MAHSLIFVHGMGEGNPRDNTPTGDYNELYNRISKAYCKRSGKTPAQFTTQFPIVEVDWLNATREAENKLFARITEHRVPLKWWDWIWNDIPWARYFMTHYVGDVIAYTAENDNGIRRKVWEDITTKTTPLVSGEYSIIAHSLGAMIMFDYLYKLFATNTPLYPDTAQEQSITTTNSGTTTTVTTVTTTSSANIPLMQKNFRHFFTFGSTIGVFLLRKGMLWNTEPPFSNIFNPVRNPGSKWLNFYDRQDVLAYPLEKIFALNTNSHPRSLRDIRVNTGWFPSCAHTNYWENDSMAAAIADALEVV